MGRSCSEPELDHYCLQLEIGGRRDHLPVVVGLVRKGHVQWRTLGAVSDGLGRRHLHAAVVALVLSRADNQSEISRRRINLGGNHLSRLGKHRALTETLRGAARRRSSNSPFYRKLEAKLTGFSARVCVPLSRRKSSRLVTPP